MIQDPMGVILRSHQQSSIFFLMLQGLALHIQDPKEGKKFFPFSHSVLDAGNIKKFLPLE